MRILIADDERLVRYSVRSMLEEIGVPARSIQVAADGAQTVEVVRETRPDVAFVDIRMPKLDGLLAIERGRVVSPHTHWVILTSHTAFDYARRALKLGVEDYLLKPVRPRDLEAVLDRITRVLREDALRLNDEFERRIGSVLHNTMSLDDETAGLPEGVRYRGALLLFDSALDEKELAERQREACELIRAQKASFVGTVTRIALCTLPVGQIALLGAWLPVDETEGSDPVHLFLRRVHVALETGCAQVRVTQIVCPVARSLPEQMDALARANELSPARVTLGIGRPLGLEELAAEHEQPGPREKAGVAVSLAAAYRARNRLAYGSELDRLAKILGSADVPETLGRFLRATIVISGTAPATLLSELAHAGQIMPAEDDNPVARALVDQVVAFVRTGFARDVGIGQIAVNLGVTPNYLSTLFHRERGVTFVKYLTRVRMQRAWTLLQAGSQVQVAAHQVGYTSVRHFSRLFQKEYGVLPSTAQEKRTAES
jgi:two-component system response regulator YesN